MVIMGKCFNLTGASICAIGPTGACVGPKWPDQHSNHTTRAQISYWRHLLDVPSLTGSIIIPSDAAEEDTMLKTNWSVTHCRRFQWYTVWLKHSQCPNASNSLLNVRIFSSNHCHITRHCKITSSDRKICAVLATCRPILLTQPT